MRWLIALLAVILVCPGCGEPEPEYQGKPLSYWTARLNGNDQRLRKSAAKVLATMGPDAEGAIPDLEKALQDKLTCALAADALGKIGPPAVPVLGRALQDKDENVRTVAAKNLEMIGAASVPAVQEALEHQNHRIRATAAKVLRNIGPAAKDAIPALEKLLDDPQERVQDMAKAALKKIRGEG